METIICLDDILEAVQHFRCPNYQVSLLVRESIHNDFIDFLGGKGINPKYELHDISYRGDKLFAIAAVIYMNRYQDNLYRIENKDPRITAMKFMDKGRNDRIYCREIVGSNGKQVIICEIHCEKKSQKNQAKERNIIKKVGEYEFDL